MAVEGGVAGTTHVARPVRTARLAPRTVTVVDVVAPVVAVGATWALRHHHGLYRVLVGEDGVFEWAQVVAFAVAGAALVGAARRARGVLGLGAVVAALACGFAIGEELAWGTRLWNGGVGFIERRNTQGDTTLHNLPGGLDASFLALSVVAVALAVALCTRVELRRAPRTLVVWLLAPASYAAWRVVGPRAAYQLAKLSEVFECLFAVALARLAVAWWRAQPMHPDRAGTT